MKKVTKSVAESVAKQMADKVYSEKIKKANQAISDFGDTLCKKYVPLPVLQVTKEYPDFFNANYYLSINFKQHVNDWVRHDTVSCNIIVPHPSKSIEITEIDYKSYKDLCKKKEIIISSSTKLVEKIQTALLALSTKKRIEEEFPEALKYLDFESQTPNLPALNMEEIRQELNH